MSVELVTSDHVDIRADRYAISDEQLGFWFWSLAILQAHFLSFLNLRYNHSGLLTTIFEERGGQNKGEKTILEVDGCGGYWEWVPMQWKVNAISRCGSEVNETLEWHAAVYGIVWRIGEVASDGEN